MRICVYGAGAIGGHLAVRLARGGAEVSVLARGAHLAAIQQSGLTVHTTEGQLNARVQASDEAGGPESEGHVRAPGAHVGDGGQQR